MSRQLAKCLNDDNRYAIELLRTKLKIVQFNLHGFTQSKKLPFVSGTRKRLFLFNLIIFSLKICTGKIERLNHAMVDANHSCAPSGHWKYGNDTWPLHQQSD